MSVEVAPAGSLRNSADPVARRELLRADDVAVTPPGASRPAVSGASLCVHAGEWVALGGPNGGGKTSLMLALAGLWPISQGTLQLDGIPLESGSHRRAASRMAVILQDPGSQILNVSVREELVFAARNLDRSEAEITSDFHHWVGKLGLQDVLDRAPASLSAGWQQLVLMGAALISRPRLLLADEPTAHLDSTARMRVRNAIEEAVRDGMAALWVTQDREEMRAAERTIWIGSSPDHRERRALEHRPADSASLARIVISPAAGEGRTIDVRSLIEFDLPARGVTAVLGPNGAGKSVLLSSLAGVAPSGQVQVEWKSLPDLPAIMALQYPELQIFEERVSDEIVFASVMRGQSRAEALSQAGRCLETLGFDASAFLERRTWPLSTGEKRLVEVVGALIAPAGLVVLDEPTAGLDADRRESLLELVAGRSGTVPVLLATQDLEWAERLADRVVRLGSEGCLEPPNLSRKRD